MYRLLVEGGVRKAVVNGRLSGCSPSFNASYRSCPARGWWSKIAQLRKELSFDNGATKVWFWVFSKGEFVWDSPAEVVRQEREAGDTSGLRGEGD
jgi:hypothetical protein